MDTCFDRLNGWAAHEQRSAPRAEYVGGHKSLKSFARDDPAAFVIITSLQTFNICSLFSGAPFPPQLILILLMLLFRCPTLVT